jgi:raffinose/stachyose/melibiose transport system substrate-binding protein
MERRSFLKCLGGGALAWGCGAYIPDKSVMEISNLQSRAGQVPINQLMWKTVDRFEKEHAEIHIEPASGGGGGYQELMIRVMEGNPPDIMSFATAETGLTYSYVEQGHVHDMTEYLQWPAADTPGKTWQQTIDPLYYNAMTYEGRFYAMPQNVISLQVYCNARLYEKAGASLNPATWEEFVDNCERLKRSGVAPITQDGIHWYTSWWFDHLAQRIAGSDKVSRAFRDPQRSVPWTDGAFLQAARMIGELLDRGYFVEGFSGLNHIESELLFWQGHAATVLVGTWFTSGRTEVIGEDFKLYAFRFPQVEGGKGNPRELIGTVNTLSIPALAKHPELAAEFLRLVSSRWFQEQMVDQARMVSPYPGMPLPDVQQGLEDVLRDTERFFPFSYGLEGSEPFLYRQYWNEWNRYMVAREISAEQLVESLERIFVRYYRTV